MHLQTAARASLLGPLLLGILVMPHAGHHGGRGSFQGAAQHLVGVTPGLAHGPVSQAERHAHDPEHASPATASVTSPSGPAIPSHPAFALSCLVVLLAGVALLVVRRSARPSGRCSSASPSSRTASRAAGRDPPRQPRTLLCVLRT